KRPLRHQLANRRCRREVTALGQRPLKVLVERGGRSHGLAVSIVDHLRINMLRGAEHREARAPIRRTLQRVTYAARAPHKALVRSGHRRRPTLLAFLAEDELARIAHALALVRLWRPEPSDLSRDLADLLLVDAGHHDL